MIGYVSYRFAFGGGVHQTGFIHDVMVKDEISPRPSWNIDTTKGDIPAERLILIVPSDETPYID